MIKWHRENHWLFKTILFSLQSYCLHFCAKVKQVFVFAFCFLVLLDIHSASAHRHWLDGVRSPLGFGHCLNSNDVHCRVLHSSLMLHVFWLVLLLFVCSFVRAKHIVHRILFCWVITKCESRLMLKCLSHTEFINEYINTFHGETSTASGGPPIRDYYSRKWNFVYSVLRVCPLFISFHAVVSTMCPYSHVKHDVLRVCDFCFLS